MNELIIKEEFSSESLQSFFFLICKYMMLFTFVLVIYIMSLASQAFGGSNSQTEVTKIKLLKLPYPFRAALTVCSDTHAAPVETFEAVHALINSRNYIKRDSEKWLRLFSDPEIDKNPAWRDGIDGFGLPISDTMWLYDPAIGVFESNDEEAGQPIPHMHNGRDFREIIDDWLQRGWVDALHTPGEWHISREATATGLKWLQERPHRHLKVWINHAYKATPTCVGPERPRPMLKNVLKLSTAALCSVGLESLVRKIILSPRPILVPLGQRQTFWLLAILFYSSALWLFFCLIMKRLRRRKNFIIGTIILLSVAVVLQLTHLQYLQGDNPKSPYYHADLIREFGIRYFWLIHSQPGYDTHVAGTLVLPEQAILGRPSILRVVSLDDGSRIMAFGRVWKKSQNAYGSLELLTADALENLCDRQGTSIIYTHWTQEPKKVFTARALRGLAHLRRFYEAGQVWVAPTSRIIHFTFIRAYLEYKVRRENGRTVIEIVQVNNPSGKPFVPTLEDLRGISFECPLNEPTEVRVGEKQLEEGTLESFTRGDRVVLRFPLEDG